MGRVKDKLMDDIDEVFEKFENRRYSRQEAEERLGKLSVELAYAEEALDEIEYERNLREISGCP